MDIITGLSLGITTALQWSNLGWCLLGVTLGTLVGVLPGIGTLTALSLLLPMTFHMDITGAIIMLAGVYYGTSYGCSITSILLNIPGTPASSVTCLDGYPMSQQGRGGVALLLTALASFAGGIIGILLLIFFSTSISELAYAFGSAEYFSIMLLGLVSASVMSNTAIERNFVMVVMGMLLGMIGIDMASGQPRFDFGIAGLIDGINVAVVAMGLFGVAEVIDRLCMYQPQANVKEPGSMKPNRDDWRRSIGSCLRGTGIGSFFGTLPGTGPAVASFVSYTVEKHISDDPKRFGQGAVEGVVAPEAANNAAAQTEFIPTLSLGIPGDATMALILAALIIQGVAPGPMLISNQPALFWGVVVSFFVGNVMLLILNIPLIRIWTSILRIPYGFIYPVILALMALGAYSINLSSLDVILVMIFGVLGWLMRRSDLDAVPLLLGFVLGPIMEEQFRKTLTISQGDFTVFVTRPLSLAFILASVTLVVWAVLRNHRSTQLAR